MSTFIEMKVRVVDEKGTTYVWEGGDHLRVLKPKKQINEFSGHYQQIDKTDKELLEISQSIKEQIKGLLP